MNTMEIHVSIISHAKTGLLLATSEDHKGLMVHGRSLEEIEARLPVAIRALLEAEGKTVASITPIDLGHDVKKAGFSPSTATFEAELCAA